MTEQISFTTFDVLVGELRARRIRLGLSQLAVDALAGLPDGYTAKCEAMLTNPAAKNARGIGRESLPLLLGALGVQLTLDASGKEGRKSEREIRQLQTTALSKFLAERSRKGQEARTRKVSPQRRRAIARKAARARWAKRKNGGR